MDAGRRCPDFLRPRTLLLLALLLPLVGPYAATATAATAAGDLLQPAGGVPAAAGAASASAAGASRRLAAAGTPRYSQMHCAGGAGPRHGLDATDDFYSCLMFDVCYDVKAGDLLFYSDGSPVLVDNDGFKYNFTEPLVLLEAESNNERTYLTPVTVLGPVPDGATYSDAPTAILMNLLGPYNVGNFLYNNMFAVFRALELFGRADAAPHDLQLLFRDTCNETCVRAHPTPDYRHWCATFAASLCNGFKKALLPTLTSRPYLEHGMPELDRTPVLCFNELIVGMADYAVWSYDHTNMRAFHDKVLDKAVPDWRQRVLARQASSSNDGGGGADRTTPPPRPLRLTVCNDTSQHAPRGLEEALALITSKLPDITVVHTELHTAAIQQQLEIMVDTDILLTSCSATSINGLFLRPASVAILIGFFDHQANRLSVDVDRLLWRQLGNVLVQPYLFTKDEVWLPKHIEPASDANDPNTLYRQHGRVVIDAQRMLSTVESAAAWVRREAGLLPGARPPSPAVTAAPEAAEVVPAAAPKYSQLHCTGGHDHQSGMGVDHIEHHTACLMRDVCYDSHHHTLLFYTDGSPIFVDAEGKHYNFTKPLVQLEPVNALGSTLKPVAVPGPVPSGSVYSAAPIGALLNLHFPFNVGHFLYDNLLAVYRALDVFDRADAVPSGLQFLFASSCAETCSRAYPGEGILPWCRGFAAPDCEKHKRTLVPAVSDYPYLERGVPELDRHPVMCFKELLVGLADFAMWVTDSTNLRRFHDAMLHRLVPDWRQRMHTRQTGGDARASVADAAATRPLRMLVYLKRGRRAPTAYLEAVGYIAARVPGLIVNVTDPATLTFQQQVEQMVETDILLSPCGGTSMTGLFLQPGSAAIIIGFFNTRKSRSWPMESIMWRQLGGVLTRHYFFTKDEVTLPQTIVPPSDSWDPYLLYRNHGQVAVNNERLLQLVEGVIQWIRRDAGRVARSGSATGFGGMRSNNPSR